MLFFLRNTLLQYFKRSESQNPYPNNENSENLNELSPKIKEFEAAVEQKLFETMRESRQEKKRQVVLNKDFMSKIYKSFPFLQFDPQNKSSAKLNKMPPTPNFDFEKNKIDIKSILQKNEPKPVFPKLHKNPIDRFALQRLQEEAEALKEAEDRRKFLQLLKSKHSPTTVRVDKMKQSALDLLDVNRKSTLGDSRSFEDEKHKKSYEMIATMTFDDIRENLESSKNKMMRELHILKEMKLERDIDLTKANLSNFRVSQKENVMNFIKRKKWEYNNHQFHYGQKVLNEKISKKFQKTVYLIMDKLSGLKLSIEEVILKLNFQRKKIEIF